MENEKEIFFNLILVLGIGLMIVLVIIVVDDNEGFVSVIDNSDIKYLIKFLKIGKKIV